MEGDGPTGALVLPHYYQLITDLKKKEAACEQSHALHPMYVKMIDKLLQYQEEAFKCETLVMATLLHPTFQMKPFLRFWSEKANYAKDLLEKCFIKQECLLKKQKEDGNEVLVKNTPAVDEDDIFSLFNQPESTNESKELEVYVKNMDCLPPPDPKDPNGILTWWKVWATLFI